MGIMLHAIWDLAHHQSDFGARVPPRYLPFCVMIDLVVGAALFQIDWNH